MDGKIRKDFFFYSFLFSALLLSAREVTITVEDADLQMPLEGAVVHSWDGSEYVCDENGSAAVNVPDDRQIVVQVTYPGYETGRLAVPPSGSSFTLGLNLGGVLESRELVIEAARPGASETRPGRSVAISGETLERSSQIGLIEDVMTSIKLLPGVGYTGMFNALPSIRGGDPGDLMSALDGFYIANPYHWGGGFSIFDPHMVESAQLSHGIFSSRYGHTISGLLEVTSKRASPDYAELELGVSTSAVNLSAAVPLGAGGGLMLMGKATYWDPFVWFLKQLSGVWESERLEMIHAVTTAPYIRSGAATFHYRVNADLEISAAAFAGTDGVGADYLNENSGGVVEYKQRMLFDWDNLQSFVIGGASYNPLPSMILKTSFGAGYEEAKVNAKIDYDYLRFYSAVNPVFNYELGTDQLDMFFTATQSSANIQGRFDFDWDLGKGFLFAAGVQELYSQKLTEYEGQFFVEVPAVGPFPPFPLPPVITAGEIFYFHRPFSGARPEVINRHFNSSAYALAEYSGPQKRFGAELGLRTDHLYFKGEGFDIQTMPVLNPRLNLDFNVFKDRGIIESFDLTAGTGLFSSMSNALASIDPDKDTDDFVMRPNRSWTSVAGVKTDFSGGWTFNLEGYFKYVYNRGYQYLIQEDPKKSASSILLFDGDGIIWGFDLMLQKFQSRYWDGWLSYTFTHARYHEPFETNDDNTALEKSDLWYYPYFHRFHNVNLVLNFKPTRNFQIYLRLGAASGRPKSVVGKVESYPVVVQNEDGDIVTNPDGTPLVINKYKRGSEYDDNSRTTWSIPLDVKLSYSRFNPRNKVLTEMYIAAENLASLVYTAQSNTSFNSYTGTEDTGSDSASYEMPVPMVSVGIKWSF